MDFVRRIARKPTLSRCDSIRILQHIPSKRVCRIRMAESVTSILLLTPCSRIPLLRFAMLKLWHYKPSLRCWHDLLEG